MSDLHTDEREFVQAIGLDPSHLDWLVKEAPPVADDLRERIRKRVQANIANADVAVAPPIVTDPPAVPASSRRHHPHFARAAAAAVLLLLVSGTTLVATSEAAQERLKELFRLVPGFGIRATSDETRILAKAPLAIASAGKTGVISAVIADKAGTEVRMEITGLPAKDSSSESGSDYGSTINLPGRTALPAWLVLPDGTRLSANSINYLFARGTLTATFRFGPLPTSVDTVRLEVPGYHDMSLNVAATLALTRADPDHYAAATPTDAMVEQSGIKVAALQYVRDDQLIHFNLSVAPTSSETRMSHSNTDPYNWVQLTDNNGHSYPFSTVNSDSMTGRSRKYNVAFVGPLQKGARELTLTVPVVYVQEEGSTPYELDVADLAVGDSRVLNQPIQVGQWPVVIEKVTRSQEDQYTFILDRGNPVGNRELDHLCTQIRHSATVCSGGIENGKQWIMVDIRPASGMIWFDWTLPTVTVRGPWVLHVPAQ